MEKIRKDSCFLVLVIAFLLNCCTTKQGDINTKEVISLPNYHLIQKDQIYFCFSKLIHYVLFHDHVFENINGEKINYQDLTIEVMSEESDNYIIHWFMLYVSELRGDQAYIKNREYAELSHALVILYNKDCSNIEFIGPRHLPTAQYLKGFEKMDIKSFVKALNIEDSINSTTISDTLFFKRNALNTYLKEREECFNRDFNQAFNATQYDFVADFVGNFVPNYNHFYMFFKITDVCW